MPNENDALLNRLIGGDPDATAEILAAANESTSPALLVAAALLAPNEEFLSRASRYAVTSRDRQLSAVAAAHLRGDADVFDVLVRDHLSDHPDSLLAAWIAGIKIRPTTDTTST